MNILFLCTENSARSLIAEALMHFHAPSMNVFSAGTKPSMPSKLALKALENAGVPTNQLTSKSLDVYADQNFDLVVTLCESAAKECHQLSHGKNYIHWPIKDPKEENTAYAFEQSIQTINSKIQVLINELNAFKTFQLTPTQFYKAIADDIRLKSLLLISLEQELCVCELMTALEQDSQPKVSRHLAQLKKRGILVDRKQQQWVFYRLNSTLPRWMKSVLTTTLLNDPNFIEEAKERLHQMGERPSRNLICCN